MPAPDHPGAWDRFAYVYNNPVRFTDPTGHFPLIPLIAIVVIVLMIPGDTGPYPEPPPANQVLSEMAMRVAYEPYDWVRTVEDCAGGRCGLLDVLGFLPGLTGAFGRVDDLAGFARRSNRAGDAATLSRSSDLAGSPPSSTLRPGPFAGESIPARGLGRRFSNLERADVDRIGRETGCHTCGTRNPGTTSGHFVPDHQPPSALYSGSTPQRLLPHCLSCSLRQGGEIRAYLRGRIPE